MAILVTGGAGYIGSHTCIELLNAGEKLVVLDNFINSSPRVIELIAEIAGKSFAFHKADLLDKEQIEQIFSENDIECVIHFAGLKAVGESVQKPLLYYKNNLTGTINLCDVMQKHGVKRMVFSSSATVYGAPKAVPIKEDFPLSTTNPYGATKLMIEGILRDICVSDSSWSVAILRYFNPIGAHESGKIGESPNGIPNNLLPYIAQVAVGKLQRLNVFGDDYPTHDGTGVRDYIHICDLASGHLAAVKKLRTMIGVEAYNLGTGKGYSVLELLRAFEKASGVKIPYVVVPRRAGDIAECYADPSKAILELGWQARRDVDKMCEDSWRFVCNNPNGL